MAYQNANTPHARYGPHPIDTHPYRQQPRSHSPSPASDASYYSQIYPTSSPAMAHQDPNIPYGHYGPYPIDTTSYRQQPHSHSPSPASDASYYSQIYSNSSRQGSHSSSALSDVSYDASSTRYRSHSVSDVSRYSQIPATTPPRARRIHSRSPSKYPNLDDVRKITNKRRARARSTSQVGPIFPAEDLSQHMESMNVQKGGSCSPSPSAPSSSSHALPPPIDVPIVRPSSSAVGSSSSTADLGDIEIEDPDLADLELQYPPSDYEEEKPAADSTAPGPGLERPAASLATPAKQSLESVAPNLKLTLAPESRKLEGVNYKYPNESGLRFWKVTFVASYDAPPDVTEQTDFLFEIPVNFAWSRVRCALRQNPGIPRVGFLPSGGGQWQDYAVNYSGTLIDLIKSPDSGFLDHSRGIHAVKHWSGPILVELPDSDRTSVQFRGDVHIPISTRLFSRKENHTFDVQVKVRVIAEDLPVALLEAEEQISIKLAPFSARRF